MRVVVVHPAGPESTFDVQSYDIREGALILTERISSYGPDNRTTVIPWAQILRVVINR